MVIQEDTPTFAPGHDRASVLQAAALAMKWLEPPADALDTMTLGAADIDTIKAQGWTTVDFEPFDASVKRTSATVYSPKHGYRRVAKGALHAIMALAVQGKATEAIEADADAKINEFALRGVRCMAVGATRGGHDTKEAAEAAPLELIGLLTFLDPPRPDTHETVEKAMAMGVDVKMATGDSLVIAKETMRMLGLGTDIISAKEVKWPKVSPTGELPSDLGTTLAPRAVRADGFAQVFPEHKFAIVEALRQAGFAVGMTGDGVNDAPALKRAHVGIAVAGATDAARAAADIVLTQPGLSAITVALREARIVFRRISNFILYRIAATLYLVAFFFIAVFAIKPSSYNVDYPKYFSLPVLLLLLITALNDGTFVFIGKDTVKPSPRPGERIGGGEGGGLGVKVGGAGYPNR
jgi:H+-transporting ATPase